MSYFVINYKGKIMPISDILEKRIQYRIMKSKNFVFMLPDFCDLSDKDQIMRALRKLIEKKLLIKVGQGIYVKAKISLISGKVIPQIDLAQIGREVAKKLKIRVLPSRYELWYNQGMTTQVPNLRVIAIEGKIVRKIGLDGSYIIYETVRNKEKYYRYN